MTFDNAKYDEVSDLVKTIELEDADFDIFDTEITLRMCPQRHPKTGEINGDAAEYFVQETGRFAIYIWDCLGEKIQRPLLFHELVEIYHRTQGMEQTPAHNATMPWEKRFCEEYLTNSELNKYLEFKKEHGYNGFDISKK